MAFTWRERKSDDLLQMSSDNVEMNTGVNVCKRNTALFVSVYSLSLNPVGRQTQEIKL